MKQNFKISYLSKDYSDIKQEITNFAKRYYSNSLVDYSDSSPLSLLIDSIAYVGDIISYNMDYSANETFLDSALDRENILKIGLQNGYKVYNNSIINGVATFYMLLPSTNSYMPDYSYSPVIRAGTQVSSKNGITFILTEDIKITKDIVGLNYTIAEVDNITNNPLYFAVKFNGNVTSGRKGTRTYEIDDFIKFRKITLEANNVVEIISVLDSDGNEYYEVESLTQNVVHKLIKNYSQEGSSSLVKPIYAKRRFTKSFNSNGTITLTFGGIDNNVSLAPDLIFDPAKSIIDTYGREYITDRYFRPNTLIRGDNFGIGPANTILTITYRVSDYSTESVPENSLKNVENLLTFIDDTNLDLTRLNRVFNSIEVTNEEAFTRTNVQFTNQELKDNIGSYIQAQNRAVTDRDYESLIYSSHPNIGRVKRCRAVREKNNFKNNLKIYVISSDYSNGVEYLSKCHYNIKQNLKNYLNNYKIMTDSIDIVDAKIINLGINYEILIDPNYNSYDVLGASQQVLKNLYLNKFYIGQNFSISEIYKQLRNITGLLDVTRVEIVNLNTDGYSKNSYIIDDNYTRDGLNLICPLNCIFEIKDTNKDIKGIVK